MGYTNFNNEKCEYVENMIFNSLIDIENLLCSLENYIRKDGYVTVAAYYELTNGRVYKNDNKYGWDNLLECTITIGRYGYELQMPKADKIVSYSKEEYNPLIEFEKDIVYETRLDAEKALKNLLDTTNEYGYVRVDDMYDFAGLISPYTASKYGWIGLRNIDVDIVKINNGYILKLPKAMPIDQI